MKRHHPDSAKNVALVTAEGTSVRGFFEKDIKIKKQLTNPFSSDIIIYVAEAAGKNYGKTARTENAEVAELADAHGSGPCGSNTLRVRLPSSA